MALPSNSFMFNYNAKNYDAVTHTFPKTQGQLFDEDLVLNTAPSSYGEDYVYFGNSYAYTGRTGYTSNNNPFDRNSSKQSLTFIYKTSGWTTNDGWTRLFANRYPSGTYNYWIMGDRLNNLIINCPNYNPQICITRINSDGTGVRKYVDVEGNIIASGETNSIDWYQGKAQGFGFFYGYADGGDSREYFNQTFYWMYCSLEALTDEQIVQVVKYNEGLSSFSINPENISLPYSGGNSAITITSDSNWSASTNDSWITVSPSSGTSAVTSTTVTASSTLFSERNGVVAFTDGDNTAELAVTQSGYKTVPFNNLFRNGNRIN